MRFLAIFFLSLSLLACAHTDPALQKWVDENLPQARAGNMRWSAYYIGLFSLIEKSSMSNRGPAMERINLLITASQLHESGKISQEEFENLRREIAAKQAKDDDLSSADSRARMAASMRAIGDAYKERADSYKPASTCRSTVVGNSVTTTCR